MNNVMTCGDNKHCSKSKAFKWVNALTCKGK